MQRLQEDSQSSYVTALFADRALSFALQNGATLEDLVYRLTFLDGRKPLAVIVNLNSHSEQQSTAAIAFCQRDPPYTHRSSVRLWPGYAASVAEPRSRRHANV